MIIIFIGYSCRYKVLNSAQLSTIALYLYRNTDDIHHTIMLTPIVSFNNTFIQILILFRILKHTQTSYFKINCDFLYYLGSVTWN